MQQLSPSSDVYALGATLYYALCGRAPFSGQSIDDILEQVRTGSPMPLVQLNPQVPGAALVVAIRQLIVFAGPAPTGWRHIGQTAFRCFRPEAADPIALKPGDEVTFCAASADEIAALADDPEGGATCSAL